MKEKKKKQIRVLLKNGSFFYRVLKPYAKILKDNIAIHHRRINSVYKKRKHYILCFIQKKKRKKKFFFKN